MRYEAEGGGIRYRKETSDERAQRLQLALEARGVAPMVLPDSDVALLLHKARRVTVTRNGVQIQLNGCTLNFWSHASGAIREAIGLTTGSKEVIGLLDEEKPDRIHLLRNTVATWRDGDQAVYWETLPLDLRVPDNDPEAKAAAIERRRREHNRVARELTTAIEPELRERDRERETNLAVVRRVTTAHGGLRHAAPGSALGRQIQDAEIVEPEMEATTREEQAADALPEYLRILAQNQPSKTNTPWLRRKKHRASAPEPLRISPGIFREVKVPFTTRNGYQGISMLLQDRTRFSSNFTVVAPDEKTLGEVWKALGMPGEKPNPVYFQDIIMTIDLGNNVPSENAPLRPISRPSFASFCSISVFVFCSTSKS